MLRPYIKEAKEPEKGMKKKDQASFWSILPFLGIWRVPKFVDCLCVIRRLSDEKKKKSYYRIGVWWIAPIIMYGVALWNVQLVNSTP